MPSVPDFSDDGMCEGDAGQRSCPGIADLVERPSFDYFVGVLVVVNAVAMGVQTEYISRRPHEDVPFTFEALETIFCGIFVMEIAARLWAHGRAYFWMTGWEFNVFDLVVVGVQLAEGALALAAALSDPLHVNVSFMRVVRLLRMVRVVRAIRVLRLIAELRTLVASISQSLRSLVWTVVLLALVLYIAGVWLTQLVSQHRAASEVAEQSSPGSLEALYGSLGASILSLFQAITGGIDWKDAVEPLTEISELLAPAFMLYIAFAVLALLNVVTGVIVESTMRSAQEDNENWMIYNTRELFLGPSNGALQSLDLKQFEMRLEKPQMREYFKAINVDPSEAGGVFTLLDLDGSGTIEAEEFLTGCLRLRGPAKALDLALLMHEVRQIGNRLKVYKSQVERVIPFANLQGVDFADNDAEALRVTAVGDNS